MITAAWCDAHKLALLRGEQGSGDDFKIALYLPTANLDRTTQAYVPDGEIAGRGYTAGGLLLTNTRVVFDQETGRAGLLWTNPTWPEVTVRGARGALIYNSSRSNLAAVVMDFGEDKYASDGAFTVRLPAGGVVQLS